MKITQVPICQRCSRTIETTSHALLGCKATKKIWAPALFTVISFDSPSQDILTTIQDTASRLRKAEIEQMVSYLRVACYARNTFLFEGKILEPRISAAKVESRVEAYQRVRKTGAAHIDKAIKEKQEKWIPPPEFFFKVNVDTTINNKDQRVGLGAVIRYPNGIVIAASIQQTDLKREVSFAEAEALRWGLQITKEAALSCLIVETYCKEVKELINNTKGSRTEIFWIVSNIQDQKKDFQKTIVQYIPRSCNAYVDAEICSSFARPDLYTNVYIVNSEDVNFFLL